VGKLDEFAWTTEGHDEPEAKHTDLRITQRGDGSYEVKTLIEPSHVTQFSSIEDLVPAVESMLHQQRSKN
jgi:hypothetical protein